MPLWKESQQREIEKILKEEKQGVKKADTPVKKADRSRPQSVKISDTSETDTVKKTDTYIENGQSLDEMLSAFEKEVLTRYIKEQNGNKSAVARLLKLSRPTLLAKLKKYGLTKAP